MRDDILDWITLSRIPGVGSLRFQFLIDHFGTPCQVFSASFQELISIQGIDKKTAQSIIENREKAREFAIRDLEYILQNQINVITYKDENYPINLSKIYNFPVFI